MNTRNLSIFAAICLAVGLPAVTNAAFYDGTDFLIAGQSPRFDNSSLQLFGYVDYAVYAPGDFTGAASFPADKYAYCYQIFDSSTSSAITEFTINLKPGITAYSTGYFASSASDIIPNGESFVAPTVTYLFNGRSNKITANNNSSVLFFAADSSWVIDSGTITGISGTTVSIPVPTPEPASILIMALAAPFLLKIRRR